MAQGTRSLLVRAWQPRKPELRKRLDHKDIWGSGLLALKDSRLVDLIECAIRKLSVAAVLSDLQAPAVSVISGAGSDVALGNAVCEERVAGHFRIVGGVRCCR